MYFESAKQDCEMANTSEVLQKVISTYFTELQKNQVHKIEATTSLRHQARSAAKLAQSAVNILDTQSDIFEPDLVDDIYNQAAPDDTLTGTENNKLNFELTKAWAHNQYDQAIRLATVAGADKGLFCPSSDALSQSGALISGEHCSSFG